MSKRDKSPSSELVAAAESLDAQLTRFESLAEQFRKAPLNSEKNLERASKLLRTWPSRIGAQRQRERAGGGGDDHTGPAADAGRVRQRPRPGFAAARGGVQGAAGALRRPGAERRGAQRADAGVRRAAREGRDARGQPEVLGTLDALNQRMGEVADEAQAVTKLGEEQDFSDIGRQADSLRQQLLSARNKLQLLRKGLASS